jgi:hydrogenase expression/formation protein HypE
MNDGGYSLTCPLPRDVRDKITLAHGGGGKMMHALIEKTFLHAFQNPTLLQRHDSAVVNVGEHRVAMTTDAFVVQPLFFPGGDLGSLSVYGTVNDLAMAGAQPLYLSAAFILEEGLDTTVLERIVDSMRRAADEAGVAVVTGDTKVVQHSRGDGCFICTTGVGILRHSLNIGPQSVQSGDVLVINGDVGRHGIAVMAVREGLEFESDIRSDSASLVKPVLALLEQGIEVHCLRDLTRGGLAAALNELARDSGYDFDIEETQVPVRDEVRGACELLGLDPLHVANEGRFLAVVPASQAERTLEILRKYGAEADTEPKIIGKIRATKGGQVLLQTTLGLTRILDMPSGEQLPRIC